MFVYTPPLHEDLLRFRGVTTSPKLVLLHNFEDTKWCSELKNDSTKLEHMLRSGELPPEDLFTIKDPSGKSLLTQLDKDGIKVITKMVAEGVLNIHDLHTLKIGVHYVSWLVTHNPDAIDMWLESKNPDLIIATMNSYDNEGFSPFLIYAIYHPQQLTETIQKKFKKCPLLILELRAKTGKCIANLVGIVAAQHKDIFVNWIVERGWYTYDQACLDLDNLESAKTLYKRHNNGASLKQDIDTYKEQKRIKQEKQKVD